MDELSYAPVAENVADWRAAERVQTKVRVAESDEGYARRMLIFRVLGLGTLALGCSYIGWRYAYSLNWNALWFAILLIAAETYSFVETIMFVFMMWKPARRVSQPPLENATVDVLITTYNEPVDIVRMTVEAALRIEWAGLRVYLLDDGARSEMRAMALELHSGYITRGEEWAGKPRHAKAGNVNNALVQTNGDFVLILDADQIPASNIVLRTIGYFREPLVAFVQTPQHFYNLPPGDPFGSDAPLFYGPIMQGKDGWNSAFFCGSNAILRREALLQVGLTDYVREMHKRFHVGLRAFKRNVAAMKSRSPCSLSVAPLQAALKIAHRALHRGQPLGKVSAVIQHGIAAAREHLARTNMLTIAATLDELATAGDARAAKAREYILTHLVELSRELKSEMCALALSEDVLDNLDLGRDGEAQPVMPLATISITEDMATAMRLHASGWQSVFHPEILAYGLAPEDMGSALSQRLRWAQGTLQLLVRDNPLFKKGLTVPQRIQYVTTAYSYFSGFFGLVFLFSPVIYLLTGIAPVAAWSPEFLMRLIPFLIMNKVLLYYVARGINIWRSEQYSVGLFPVWIRAVVSVLLGRRINFVVTPKQRRSGNYLPLVWPQIAVIVLTAFAALYGLSSLTAGRSAHLVGIVVNVCWGVYNIAMLLAVVRAAIYRPGQDWVPRPPAFLFQRAQ